jgi:hypothetical protein
MARLVSFPFRDHQCTPHTKLGFGDCQECLWAPTRLHHLMACRSNWEVPQAQVTCAMQPSRPKQTLLTTALSAELGGPEGASRLDVQPRTVSWTGRASCELVGCCCARLGRAKSMYQEVLINSVPDLLTRVWTAFALGSRTMIGSAIAAIRTNPTSHYQRREKNG